MSYWIRFSFIRESDPIEWKTSLITILEEHLVLKSSQIHHGAIYLCRFIWLLEFFNYLFYQLLCSLSGFFFKLLFYIFRVCCLNWFLFLFYDSITNFFNIGAINSVERICLYNIDDFISFLFLSYSALLLVNF